MPGRGLRAVVAERQARFNRTARFGAVLAVSAALLAGCVARPTFTMQTIQVLVEADDPAWSGALECEASNSAGRWAFSAPGAVAVRSSASELQISCTTPAGTRAEPSATAARFSDALREGARGGASTGGKVGAGAGLALGVAAVPVMGPAFAVVLAVGSAFTGSQLGGVVGALASGERLQYPSPVVLHITALNHSVETPAAGSVSTQ